jgi:RNA polymerase sigma-70 factor (ECF subfamily)
MEQPAFEPREPQDPRAGPHPELARWLAEAARGDDAAWRRIIDLYARRIYALARSRLGKDHLAEEVTQSVFVTVATKLAAGDAAPGSGYVEQGKFEAWLFRIATNRVRDEARRLKRRAVVGEGLDHEPVAGASAGRATERAEPRELALLRDAMLRLGDDDREVVELRHHAGLSFRQIADLLNEPLGTLLARHHRALRKLKGMLEDAGARPEPA